MTRILQVIPHILLQPIKKKGHVEKHDYTGEPGYTNAITLTCVTHVQLPETEKNLLQIILVYFKKKSRRVVAISMLLPTSMQQYTSSYLHYS